MLRLALMTAGALVAASATAPAQTLDDAELREALVDALSPALPFPAARDDGTPESGAATPVWTVRWAEGGEPFVEVLANPLNDGNRQRALAAEKAIQTAAMQAQRRSQSDYEQALTDFKRTGRTSAIREISLDDDGVAGERFDAESQLTVSAELVEAPRTVTVMTGLGPEIVTDVPGASAAVRVHANTYVEDGADGLPGTAHYCAEQAWIFIGAIGPHIGPASGGSQVDIDVSVRETSRRAGILVWIRGNADLVDQVVKRAAWAGLAARAGG